MGTRTIRLDEDVYEYLKSRKRNDETFSEAVERLTRDWSLQDLAGTYTDDEADRHRELLRESERTSKRDREELLGELGLDDE